MTAGCAASAVLLGTFGLSAGAMGGGVSSAISRALGEAHGGQRWYESEPGAGAIFHFSIPFA